MKAKYIDELILKVNEMKRKTGLTDMQLTRWREHSSWLTLKHVDVKPSKYISSGRTFSFLFAITIRNWFAFSNIKYFHKFVFFLYFKFHFKWNGIKEQYFIGLHVVSFESVDTSFFLPMCFVCISPLLYPHIALQYPYLHSVDPPENRY